MHIDFSMKRLQQAKHDFFSTSSNSFRAVCFITCSTASGLLTRGTYCCSKTCDMGIFVAVFNSAAKKRYLANWKTCRLICIPSIWLYIISHPLPWPPLWAQHSPLQLCCHVVVSPWQVQLPSGHVVLSKLRCILNFGPKLPRVSKRWWWMTEL